MLASSAGQYVESELESRLPLRLAILYSKSTGFGSGLRSPNYRRRSEISEASGAPFPHYRAFLVSIPLIRLTFSLSPARWSLACFLLRDCQPCRDGLDWTRRKKCWFRFRSYSLLPTWSSPSLTVFRSSIFGRGCKVDSTAAFDLNAGLNETIKRCVSDEQQAKDQLQSQWPGFINSDRTMCLASTTNDPTTPPSYVDFLTCLQDQQLARKLPKN